MIVGGVIVGTYSSIYVAERDRAVARRQARLVARPRPRPARAPNSARPRPDAHADHRGPLRRRAADRRLRPRLLPGRRATCTAGRWRCCRPARSAGPACPTSRRSSPKRPGSTCCCSAWAPRSAPLDPALRAALEAAGIGVEIMSTPSACRTYNVLLGEGRRVAAGADSGLTDFDAPPAARPLPGTDGGVRGSLAEGRSYNWPAEPARPRANTSR